MKLIITDIVIILEQSIYFVSRSKLAPLGLVKRVFSSFGSYNSRVHSPVSSGEQHVVTGGVGLLPVKNNNNNSFYAPPIVTPGSAPLPEPQAGVVLEGTQSLRDTSTPFG